MFWFKDSDLSLGNKLLVYVSCCLAGQAYPIGTIPEDYAQKVKKEVEFLFQYLLLDQKYS